MKISGWDRFTMSFAPRWTLRRLQAKRVALALEGRQYEAASVGRRTQGWARNKGDANALLSKAIPELRMHSRDLIRNNSWARRAQRVIANNVVGWGLVPHPRESISGLFEAWKAWADSTECHNERRLTFAGIQHLVMKAVVSDGEVLIRRRPRKDSDGLVIPMQLEIIEADCLDITKDQAADGSRGAIVQGIEYNRIGQRVAYWVFPRHPGSTLSTGEESQRVSADDILHVFYTERPGQARGVSWFGSAIVNLKDLDEYEDAELMKQKIASCFAAFVVDSDGAQSPLGNNEDDEEIESLEPGMVEYLPPGKDVKFGNPPTVTDVNFANRNLRKIAAGIGITYEDMTGDYSQVNFSSARMARLAHWSNVHDWRWNMIVPLLCDGVWRWAMEQLAIGRLERIPSADWTAPPMPMIEPDREGLAYQRLVRTGVMTHAEMVREQGGDPQTHWKEYSEGLKQLDSLGIVLDSDARAVSQAGQTQQTQEQIPDSGSPQQEE